MSVRLVRPESDADPRAPGVDAVAGRPVVRVVGGDPLSRAGVAAFLADETEVVVADGTAASPRSPSEAHPRPAVVILVVDAVDERAASTVRALPREPGDGLLVVAGRLDAAGLALAVREGALGVLRRGDLSAATLTRAVGSVRRGEAVVPPDLLGQLLAGSRPDNRDDAQTPALSVVRVSDRERAVLRFLAEGADTRQIARALTYSERTVKTVIQDLTRRFGLRNRAHAVAYAVRNGLV